MTSKTMPLSGGDYILDDQGLRRAETVAASRSTAAVDQADAPAAIAAAPVSDTAPTPVSTPRPASRARTQRRTSTS